MSDQMSCSSITPCISPIGFSMKVLQERKKQALAYSSKERHSFLPSIIHLIICSFTLSTFSQEAIMKVHTCLCQAQCQNKMPEGSISRLSQSTKDNRHKLFLQYTRTADTPEVGVVRFHSGLSWTLPCSVMMPVL